MPETEPRKSTVLVTGAMGMLGTHVTELLLERDLTVVALDVRTKQTEAAARRLTSGPGRPGRLVLAYVDLLDAAAVQRLLSEHEPTAIVHLAAIIAPACYRNPSLAHRVNVDGTRNLIEAASALPVPPLFVQASSVSVYGSRNPHTQSGRLTGQTPVNPADCYGQQKVEAERLVATSGLPHAILRIGGIISPEALVKVTPEVLALMRATPRDNRLHTVDARDAALAFANAAELRDQIDGRTLLIGGNASNAKSQREIEDDCMQALGLGRLGPHVGLPGDPNDDDGWGLTDWMDTTEAQELLKFQSHDWAETLAWVSDTQGWKLPALRVAGPALRPVMRLGLAAQRRYEKRGPYAEPWKLIAKLYGNAALASADA